MAVVVGAKRLINATWEFYLQNNNRINESRKLLQVEQTPIAIALSAVMNFPL